VGFRWWTSQRGRELGLRGFVRNEEDGSVRIEAYGETRKVEQLAQALRQGPPMAQVTEVQEIDPIGDHPRATFEVLR